jgi:hypothetical protein
MHGFKRYLTVLVALACGVTVMSGSAFAGPPSAPPGQEKKAEEATAPAPAAAPADKTPPGQEKKAEQAKGVNGTDAGVKPSNSTEKNTKTTVGASPDVSKRYGNGKTAAQIAKSRGAPGSTEIRGPGNSQPHKVCRNGHWVDVHAVKSYSDNTCGTSSSTPSSATTPLTQSALPTPASPVPVSTPAASAGSVPSTVAPASAVGTAAGTSTPAGGVLGAQHTEGKGATGGVLGAFKSIGGVAAGSLPFTGFPLWAVALIGLAAVALGWLLWRHSRGTVTSDAV